MKKIILSLIAVALALNLAACQTKQETGTLAGGAVGGLIGAQFGGGTTAHVLSALGGALVGGLIGGAIGQSMDKQDQKNMQSAVSNTPVGQSAVWTNDKTKTTYVVTPVKNYNQNNEYCREYQTKVTVNGQSQKAYGTACRQPDGAWHIVS